MLNSRSIDELFNNQLSQWKLARDNYKALDEILIKEVVTDEFLFKVQFNPARIRSSGAKIDKESIRGRSCFLCRENMPAEQSGILFGDEEDIDREYIIVINPYPIFSRHLTIPTLLHTSQLIGGRFSDLITLAAKFPEYTFFYNGPNSGASAPDHFHFQAGSRGFLPIEIFFPATTKKSIFKDNFSTVSYITNYLQGVLAVESSSLNENSLLLERIFTLLPVKERQIEPMINIITWFESELSGRSETNEKTKELNEQNSHDKIVTLIFMREKHRPSHYYAQGEAKMLISPGAVDLGGVLITPLESDFDKVNGELIKEIFNEVCLGEEESQKIISLLKSEL